MGNDMNLYKVTVTAQHNDGEKEEYIDYFKGPKEQIKAQSIGYQIFESWSNNEHLNKQHIKINKVLNV